MRCGRLGVLNCGTGHDILVEPLLRAPMSNYPARNWGRRFQGTRCDLTWLCCWPCLPNRRGQPDSLRLRRFVLEERVLAVCRRAAAGASRARSREPSAVRLANLFFRNCRQTEFILRQPLWHLSAARGPEPGLLSRRTRIPKQPHRAVGLRRGRSPSGGPPHQRSPAGFRGRR